MQTQSSSAPDASRRETQAFLGRAAAFTLVGMALYAGAYVWAERLLHAQPTRNRFHAVAAAPSGRYDHVIAGASHAAVLDYRDMNARLERMTGARILNLSVVGGGITVSRLLIDYFLTRHETGAVLYVVDSFAFYSSEWNETRLRDSRLYARAPFDLSLAELLWRRPATRWVAVDHLFGFSKINNEDRFLPDVPAEEGQRFERTHRPVGQIDRQRLSYLYPERIDPDVFDRYMAEFDELARDLQSRRVRFMIVKPPIPERVIEALPAEAEFDRRLAAIAERRGASLHDFSRAGNDDGFFYDTDHLNQAGVLNFFEMYLAPLLRP